MILNGTWGQVWFDGELVAETYKMQAKTMHIEEESKRGIMWADSKAKSMGGKGSVGLHKASSRAVRMIGERIRWGNDPRFTIVSKLDDPDAYGAEQVAVKNVSFDGLTLADWEAMVFGKVECPFVFEDYKYPVVHRGQDVKMTPK